MAWVYIHFVNHRKARTRGREDRHLWALEIISRNSPIAMLQFYCWSVTKFSLITICYIYKYTVVFLYEEFKENLENRFGCSINLCILHIYICRGRLAFYDPYISVHSRGRNRTSPNLLPRVEAIVYTYAMTNYEYHYSFYKMSCHFGIRLSK